MVKLESLLQYMDEYLSVADFPDYEQALNGLQVDGPSHIGKVAAAVDASEASITAAAAAGVDLLLVHHGLFWDGLKPLVGRRSRRVKALFDASIALYSCHLPLDAHTEVGNCALLMRAIGLEPQGRLGRYRGSDLGWWGALPEPCGIGDLEGRVSAAVGGPVRTLNGGPAQVRRVGVLTGSGGSFVQEAKELGLDAFVTGEAAHHTFFDAAEYGIHVLLAGHYATETFGVRGLVEHIGERFELSTVFIDQPTGL
jgi:dinuclear metal center YbgI/SA1388 family protein